MKANEFFKIEFDDIEEIDIDRANYILNKIPNDYKVAQYINPSYNFDSKVDKAIEMFNVYRSENLMDLLTNMVHEEIAYTTTEFNGIKQGNFPIKFAVDFVDNGENKVLPIITYPRILDDVSYVFLGNNFHIALKDLNENERKLKNRFEKVIPMFYELVSSDLEEDEYISKEILTRRISLLSLDKNIFNDKLQKFNSYYYSLCLYNKYKENPILVLRLVTRVLLREITTLDLLNILNIYDNKLDNIVDDELYKIKEYIHS